MYGPMLLAVLLVLMNIPMYFYQKEAGLAISVFTVVYCIVVTVSFHRSKPYFMNELINFATQYGTVQKKLLNEFDVAYALIDYNVKFYGLMRNLRSLPGKTRITTGRLPPCSHILQEKLFRKIRQNRSFISAGMAGSFGRS